MGKDNPEAKTDKTTAITHAQVFDGENAIGEQTVVIGGTQIQAVGGSIPAGAAVMDAHGGTLMPGLIEALRAAASVPARRFRLNDRGRIAAGARADLLLVDGDPTSKISDTLSIGAVWRRGSLLAAQK